ncbi:peptidoglycan-binding protein [Mycobacterium vicinigordonae]|nr:peptidoglycan-binding protein [Mycobacterium vicinigordonae]
MQINGVWVGWGLGDHSAHDLTVQQAKKYMRAAFRSYAGSLRDTNIFDQQMQDTVTEMQKRLVADGALTPGQFVVGVLDLPTEYAMGFRRRPTGVQPVFFTVEGHMSNMFAGPVADTATRLEAEGHCHHQPIGYNNGAIPFDNASGVEELARLVGSTTMDNGVPFPAGTPWGLGIYSQGAIIGSMFWSQYLQPGQPLDWRAADLKGVLAYANPWREKNQVAEWAVPGGPDKNTQGLSDQRLTNTPTFWKEVCRHGDIFAENSDDEEGQIKTAVYTAVMGNFFLGPYSILAKLTAALQKPGAELEPIVTSIYSGFVFLISNPNPHYAPFIVDGGLDFMRRRLTGQDAVPIV